MSRKFSVLRAILIVATTTIIFLSNFNLAKADIFDYEKLTNYTNLVFGFNGNISKNDNELWRGILKDCSKKLSVSCIQKNAYTYLDRALIERDNITIFDGFNLRKNELDFDRGCVNDGKKYRRFDEVEDDDNNSISINDVGVDEKVGKNRKESYEDVEEEEEEVDRSPLEEVTHALREKTVKFLATRDYELRLPAFIERGVNLRISPKEIDANGALIRIDFSGEAFDRSKERGRIFFKKIKKHIQNKIFMLLLALILVIKIIKLKFMFVIPFLFGIGTAKKLFLKLLLFFVPAFAHVFKLCSSYYTNHPTRYHHHQHKIAHHHHHIPVPVPVYQKPSGGGGSSHVYFDHPPSSHPHNSGPIILDEDFQGYDYAHPHIQYRKDMEELKEWGIEPYDDSNYLDQTVVPAVANPASALPTPTKLVSSKLPPLGMPPPPPPFPFGMPTSGQSMAYAAYAPNGKGIPPHGFSPQRNGLPPLPPPPGLMSQMGFPPTAGQISPVYTRPKNAVAQSSGSKDQTVAASSSSVSTQSVPVPKQQQQQQSRPLGNNQQQAEQDLQTQPSAMASTAAVAYDDAFFGPMMNRLDRVFEKIKGFSEENCRERLVCSMYKNPTSWSPISNIVSNELSKEDKELPKGKSPTVSSSRFYRYLEAARLGQDGGDCMATYQCAVRTE